MLTRFDHLQCIYYLYFQGDQDHHNFQLSIDSKQVQNSIDSIQKIVRSQDKLKGLFQPILICIYLFYKITLVFSPSYQLIFVQGRLNSFFVDSIQLDLFSNLLLKTIHLSYIEMFEAKHSIVADQIHTNAQLIFSEKEVDTLCPEGKIVDHSTIGRWSYQEKKLYLDFIESHRDVLETKQMRRNNRIFKLMSGSIKTRRADQCRSHHQKMQKKCNSLREIILTCRQHLSLPIRELNEQKIEDQLIIPYLNENEIDLQLIESVKGEKQQGHLAYVPTEEKNEQDYQQPIEIKDKQQGSVFQFQANQANPYEFLY